MTNLFFKQSPWSHLVAAGTFALLFAACGDEITEVTEVVGMQVVEAGDALPKCTADNEGAMVYSVDSAAAYTCIGKKWTSMRGKDGKDGADGKDGKDGKNGINGTNGTNESSSCTAKALKNGKGYKIVCGGDSVGVVLNGQDGAKGAPGVKGDPGANGTSCSAEEDSDGVKITCTDGKSFTLSDGADGSDGRNCEIVSDLNGAITLKCGDDITTLYKAMCNLTPYDPTQQYCSVQGILDLKKCGDNLYNPESHLCDTRDSIIYRHVMIGSQIWMAENLNYKTENSWCGGGSDENEGDCTKYGRLYIWADANDACPEGWHLPDTTEWSKLFTAVGGYSTAGKKLKSQTGWNYNGNGTDDYGFSAFPAGIRYSNGNFDNEGSSAYFWSATELNGDPDYSGYAYNMTLIYIKEDAGLGRGKEIVAFSVRCLKD